jgi:glycosyltransferase involved in cell wall biosynthesis
MRILVNAWPVHGPRSGVGHYTAELLRCLENQSARDEQIVARPGPWVGSVRRWFQGASPLAPVPGGRKHTFRRKIVRFLKPLGRSLLRQYLRATAWAGRFDVYHEPNFIPVPCGVPTAASLHDLSVLLHPEWHPADRVAWFERHFARRIAHCVHFFAISESGRQEIIHTLGIPAQRVTRTYMGIRPWLRPLPQQEVTPVLQALGLPPRYLLCVGTIEPRKNVLTLLRAYCDLPASVRAAYPLVLAGGWGWRAEEVADFFESTARHQGVLRLGYVPEQALAAVYNGARALVFPSLYEGFGLPPVEMLACGGAVLASTAAAVAEVVGGQAQLLEPHDLEGWRDGMRRVLTDDDWWLHLRKGAVEHARPFTWERCAADTLNVYRQVAAGNFDFAASAPLTSSAA